MDQIIVLNAVTTCILTGLIWVIQLVHYPSFQFISKNEFSNFMSFHVKAMSYIAAPLMIIELMASIYILIYNPSALSLINIIPILFIWSATFLLSVPCHQKLKSHYDQKIIKRLVLTNWPRTFLWNFKAVISIIILLH